LLQKAFEITAWNPFGKAVDEATNCEQTNRLQKDIEQCKDVKLFWPSSGFDLEGWQEDGFVIWFAPDASDHWIMEIGRKYKQGAVFAYRFSKSDKGLKIFRKTLPIMIENDNENEIEMMTIRKPIRDDI
jgi:hypothetical protein